MVVTTFRNNADHYRRRGEGNDRREESVLEVYDEEKAELIKIKNMEKEAKLCMKEKENKQMEERFERARLILTRMVS